MSKDALGDRMKDFYENRTKFKLPRRTNTMIRLDGKAFHTFTRGMDKPFDETLSHVMDLTTLNLCRGIQGCVMGYVQSDEITLLLTDYSKLTTNAWFDGNIQKIVSVSASMCTAFFNDAMKSTAYADSMAFFDSRTYTIPDRGEVMNNFIWRQQDAVKNSISMVAQSLYSDKELDGKNQNERQEMCFQKGVNWDKINAGWKRGRMVIKELSYKKIGEIAIEKLKKDEDERLTWSEKDGYRLRVYDWKIRPAIDFNKNNELFMQYLELEKNIDLF